MLTNTFLTWFFILSLMLSAVNARSVKRDSPKKFFPRIFKKSSERLKREFDPQTSPLNTVRSALQWRPNSQQPQGQVYK